MDGSEHFGGVVEGVVVLVVHIKQNFVTSFEVVISFHMSHRYTTCYTYHVMHITLKSWRGDTRETTNESSQSKQTLMIRWWGGWVGWDEMR